MFSQYVEQAFAAELLATGTEGLGYLLKDRVADVAEFVDAVRRVGNGGTALDPEVVTQLLARSAGRTRSTGSPRGARGAVAHGRGRSTRRSPGRSSSATARSKSTSATSSPSSTCRRPTDNRRVLAVLRWLGA